MVRYGRAVSRLKTWETSETQGLISEKYGFPKKPLKCGVRSKKEIVSVPLPMQAIRTCFFLSKPLAKSLKKLHHYESIGCRWDRVYRKPFGGQACEKGF